MLVDGFAAIWGGAHKFAGGWSSLFDNIRLAVLVNYDLVAFLRIGVSDAGDRDGDDLAFVGADFNFCFVDF